MNQTDFEKILFLDIETVPVVYEYDSLSQVPKALWDKKWQYQKDVTPQAHYAKAGIYAEFAKIVCIGVGHHTGGKFQVKAFTGDNEVELLSGLSGLLGEKFNSQAHYLCAHNGREFDFPFLCRRFIVNRLPLPKLLQLQGLKPWEVKHIDTMDLWKFGDVKNFSSLDLLAYVFGLESPKGEMDGSMVGKTYYEDRDLAKIERYCKSDVLTLARVYGRFAGRPDLRDDDIIFA